MVVPLDLKTACSRVDGFQKQIPSLSGTLSNEKGLAGNFSGTPFFQAIKMSDIFFVRNSVFSCVHFVEIRAVADEM